MTPQQKVEVPTDSRKLYLTTVQQYCVNFLVEQGFATRNLAVHDQFLLDSAMMAIRISFKYPAKVLQQHCEIARYPATLWSHLLDAIGLKQYATYKSVLLNEHLAFPSIEIPPELKIDAQVCFDWRTELRPVQL